MNPQESLSLVYPCFNDAKTIEGIITISNEIAEKLARDYEIIVVDDGSADESQKILLNLGKKFPRLKVYFNPSNQGYGKTLRTGFGFAAKDLIFYTDGDAQYDVKEIEKLLPLMTPEIAMVTGYKIKRNDSLFRVIAGATYQFMSRLLFRIKVRDVNCDFRLIRRQSLAAIQLSSCSGAFGLDLVKSMERNNSVIVEVPVHHYPRCHGMSQFFSPRPLWRTVRDFFSLWKKFFVSRRDV